MEVVELIAEGDKVAGRFTCSATHLGEWLGQAPTGRRFERLDEVSIFRFRDDKIALPGRSKTPGAPPAARPGLSASAEPIRLASSRIGGD
jgi:hypothetical protein